MKHIRNLTVARAQGNEETPDINEILTIVFDFVLDLVEAKGKIVNPVI